MKKLALAFLFCGAMAFADSITYWTTGAFSGPALGSGNSLSFTGNGTSASPISIVSPTELLLGTVSASGTFTVPSTESFTLNFFQQLPSSGTGSLVGSLTGTVTGSTSSTIQITFTSGTWTEPGNGSGLEYYNLGTSPTVQLTWGVPASNSALSGQIDAFVTSSPEPASLSMIGAGLVGLGLVARRRLAK